MRSNLTPFSEQEYQRRLAKTRAAMLDKDIDVF